MTEKHLDSNRTSSSGRILGSDPGVGALAALDDVAQLAIAEKHLDFRPSSSSQKPEKGRGCVIAVGFFFRTRWPQIIFLALVGDICRLDS